MYIVGGAFHRRPLKTPKGDTTRPTSAKLRSTLFNILQEEVVNAEFLDIFAGSGAIGLEALSRGAKSSSFIENHREALKCLEENIQTLKVSKEAEIYAGDFEKMLKKLISEKRHFDLIFADAPYHLLREGLSVSKIIVNILSSSPLLKLNGKCFIENDQASAVEPSNQKLALLNSRKSGKAFLHQYQRVLP